jgi:hypothetical protein
MKVARVKRQDRSPGGGVRICIQCPICRSDHWLPDSDVGKCPRRPGTFTIQGRKR